MARPATNTRPVTEKTPTPNTALAAVKSGGALANAAVPAFMQADKGQGTELITSNDIETPRLKLLQAVSPEVEAFNDAKQGEFWHSVAEVSLGAEVRIVPLYIDMRAILWRPRHDGGGILARADDGVHWNIPDGKFEVKPVKGNKKTVVWSTAPTVAASRLLEWGTSDPDDPNSAPAATRMYNMAVALPGFPELGIGVVTLQRSSIKVARKFLGKLKMSNAPSYGTFWKMGHVVETSDDGNYFNYKLTSDGFVTDQDEYETYKALYEKFKELGLQIRDLESAQDEGGQPATDEPETRKGVKY